MKTTDINALLMRRYSLEKQLDDVQATIARMDDGFQYCVTVHKYRNCTKRLFSNYVAAFDYASLFVGDNGYANIYTNNPKVSDTKRLYNGKVYYIENVNMIDGDGNPKIDVDVLVRSMKEYSKSFV